MLLAILEDPSYPDFLTLPDENVPAFQNAGMMMGNGFDAFVGAFGFIRAETDDPADDVLTYDDLNGNAVWDTDEPFHHSPVTER
ncbi:MAG: hypothetical protein M5R36_22250 [Deltaproteobacteria bacterium]|nr:hypothetical protein [Deltaproteobacteria bacterium]